MFGRTKIAMIVAEFIGSFSLASVVLAMLLRTSFPLFNGLAAGGALAVLTLVFANVETGFYNPAATLGLWTLRKIETSKAIVFIAAQFLGGYVALTVNQFTLNNPLNSLANNNTDWRLFTAEAVGALVFSIGLAGALYRGYKDLTLALAVGGSLTLGIILASFAGNGLINPAVALGIKSWSYMYLAAPLLGAVVGMNLYSLLFNAAPGRALSSSRATSRKTPAKRSRARSTRR
jgi:glycerol uptake facilitator-like aquaporin